MTRKLSLMRLSLALISCLVFFSVAMHGPAVRQSLAQSCPDCTTDLEDCNGLPGLPPQSPPPRSFDDFIIQAYLGALGRFPTCFERLSEYNRLANTAPGNDRRLEARRFVATLFMTQESYSSPDPNNYRQTNAYQQRNPQECDDRPHRRSFVADLYRAFLQREPDQAGHCFWSNEVCMKRVNHGINGRKEVIKAFEVSIEFENLVGGLFDGGEPCCPRPCPIGTVFNPDTCSCEDSGGCPPGLICDQQFNKKAAPQKKP